MVSCGGGWVRGVVVVEVVGSVSVCFVGVLYVLRNVSSSSVLSSVSLFLCLHTIGEVGRHRSGA